MSFERPKLVPSHYGSSSSPKKMADENSDLVPGDESMEAETSTAEQTQEVSQDVGMTNGDDGNNAPTVDETQNDAAFEPRIPAKKDATLREFLGKMDDYAPIVR